MSKNLFKYFTRLQIENVNELTALFKTRLEQSRIIFYLTVEDVEHDKKETFWGTFDKNGLSKPLTTFKCLYSPHEPAEKAMNPPTGKRISAHWQIFDLDKCSYGKRTPDPISGLKIDLDTRIWESKVKTFFKDENGRNKAKIKGYLTAGVSCSIHDSPDGVSGVSVLSRTKYAFHHFTVQEVEQGINDRIANPNLIDQGTTSLCGMAVVTYFYAKHKPNDYKQFVKSLHKNGEATSAAGYHLKKDQTEHLWDYERNAKQGYPNDSTRKTTIHPVDFMLLSSLRTQENGALDYEPNRDHFVAGKKEELTGMSLPNEVEKLMRELIGFKSVVNKTNLAFSKPNFYDVVNYAQKLQNYLASGYSVALLVNMGFLYNEKRAFSIPEHWVGLGSISVNQASKTITMQLFTWGESGYIDYWLSDKHVISFDVFIDNFYGYVAGK
jgi:hypothetical protein